MCFFPHCGFQTPVSMHTKKRPASSLLSGGLVCWPSLSLRQPPRVLIVEALPPWWSETCAVLCEALDNFLSLACSLDGPCRIPLLSLYAISRQQECLLPFVVRRTWKGTDRQIFNQAQRERDCSRSILLFGEGSRLTDVEYTCSAYRFVLGVSVCSC